MKSKKFYVEISKAKTGAIYVEGKYYEAVDTYEMAYSIISNELVADGTDVSYYEDMYLEQNFNEQYKEAQTNDTMGEFFDKMFDGVLQEEDYKKLLELLENIPSEFDPEEELADCIANKHHKSDFYGDGLRVVAEYLEGISRKDALDVVTYYYFNFGFGYEDQLISDIKSDQEDGVLFDRVERATTI